MSDEEGTIHISPSESLLTTEYRDGQLQIVEVAPFKQGKSSETHILPDLDTDMPETRYVQVLNPDKSVVQLDLLNMTLVRCDDGSDTTYKLVANTEPSDTDTTSDTVTCVLQASDQEDQDNQDAFVVMDGQQTPLVFLQSDISETNSIQTDKHEEKARKPSATEILEKAKALKQTAQLLQASKPRRTGRKRRCEFPAPHELLASPNFKLFLYSCKMCHFKCNAVKEMTAHKAEEHSSGARARAGRAGAPLQCAKCPYKATSHSQLMKHVQERHLAQTSNIVSLNSLDSKEIEEAHVLVCGACGFECNTKVEFKVHIREQHGATAVSI